MRYPEPIRLLVCGPRDWTDEHSIWQELDAQVNSDHVEQLINGCAPGVDTFADRWARDAMIPVRRFLASWKHEGRAAGPIRNQSMIDEGRPTLCIAFQRKGVKTRGTQDMIWRARKAGIETRVIEL